MLCRVAVSTGGNAAISTPDSVYTYNRSEGLRDASGTDLGMWLQPGFGLLARLEEEDIYPFASVTARIDLEVDVQNASVFFLTSLDPDFSAELRRGCASLAHDACENPEIAKRVRALLLKVPLPDEMEPAEGPKEGVAGQILKEMLAKWRP